MTITPKTLVIALLIVGGLLFLWPKRTTLTPPSVPASTPVYETRQNSGGEVTVSATPITLELEQKPQFQISFETHSVDLNFDVAEIALLVDDQGNTYGLATWSGSPPGGHHRSGTLTFENPLQATVDSVSLRLQNIADVSERSFQWTIL